MNGIVTRERLRGMMDGRNCYAVDVVSLFAVAFISRSLGFVERYDLTRMKMLYTEKFNKFILGHQGGARVESETVRLQSEI